MVEKGKNYCDVETKVLNRWNIRPKNPPDSHFRVAIVQKNGKGCSCVCTVNILRMCEWMGKRILK